MAPKNKKAAIPPRKKTTVKESPPNWPPLTPLAPAIDLTLESLLEDQILVIRNLFTSTLCRNYVSFLSSLPLTTTSIHHKKDEALRVNDRFMIDDPAFAEMLWSQTALRDLVVGSTEDEGGPERRDLRTLFGGEVLGLNPRIRVYRYGKGQFFAEHYDESNNITLPTTPPTQAKTTWTLLIYLTGPATGCIGGETIFYPELGAAKHFSGKSTEGTEPISVGLEVGMALLHKHGQDCLLHEGAEVKEGEKWVIRSDLCVKR